MSILQLEPVIFGETDQLITYLQRKNLLASNKTCPCGTAMQLSTRSDVSDGVRFRCPGCHKCTTIWEGSFFSKSRLSLQKWVILMYWWACNYPVTDAAHEADVTEATACAVYQWLREVCTTRLLQTPIRLGGPGTIVQIDKSLMNHKPKVKIINNIICTDEGVGKCFISFLCTVPPWAKSCNRELGICSCRHITHIGPWLHGACS